MLLCATRVSNKKNNDVREVVPTAILINFIIFIIFRGGRRLYHPPMRAPKGKVITPKIAGCLDSVLFVNNDTINAGDISVTPSILVKLPRMSMTDREELRRLLTELDRGIPPRYSGLERVTCRV